MLKFQNYHRHSERTNPIISDSTVKNEDYAKAAVERGHQILASTEHGYQGRYIECYDLAKEYNLKFLFGTEAYWVMDRTQPDNTNCHIWIGAKNENGRQSINDILSEGNLTGFYYRARIDVPLILSLPKDDVWLTTACIAGWKYEDADDIFHSMFEHFGKNFFLEVQYHNTQTQKDLNRRILELHNKWKCPIIMGCDSHYITANQATARDDFLTSKGFNYEDEKGWFLDYPDGDTAYERFAEQNVLSHSDIIDAIGNTNIFCDVKEYESDIFTDEIKMPSLYPNWTQEQKDAEYERLVWQGFDEYKSQVDPQLYPLYENEIKSEIAIVKETKMADYFIDNYYVIKKGKENGGWLTKTGRGCFCQGCLVHTETTLKPIEDICVGDYVFDMYGTPKRVLDTHKYKIQEEMVEIVHSYSAGAKHPLVCTLDHKIYVRRNGINKWVEAKDITNNDYVICPKIRIPEKSSSMIDLNLYNEFGYEYDDSYIYEYNPYKNNEYKNSPSEISRNTKWGKSIIEGIANGTKKKPKKVRGWKEIF